MLSAKPPLMLPILKMPATLWNALPLRVGTGTILAPALAVYALFLLAGWIWGDYGYFQEQARLKDDLYSTVLAKWVPVGLLWALLLPVMAERRTAWALSGVCVAAALYIPAEVVPFEAFWWIAAALLLSWAIITSLPSATRLVKLALFSHRERSKPSLQLVPVRRGQTRRRFSDGLLRSLAPIWMLPLAVFSAVIQRDEYFFMKDSLETRDIAWESLGSSTWSATGPIFLVGGSIWCTVGLFRMVMERLIGNVVWLLPETADGHLDVPTNPTHVNGSCTPQDVVITPDKADCPMHSREKMWLGFTGSDSQGHLLHWCDRYWSDQRELARHRCDESEVTEKFRGIRWLEGHGTKDSKGTVSATESLTPGER
ncbi:hypothetical protein CQ018_00020 [Arthrobacter sp. MYb227]|nr:hypothetical protein CQ018_00020 [Arthrobacter sp. MYb227]